MDNNDNPYIIPTLPERVAVLEVRQKDTSDDLKDIKDKLDQLLELKTKGAGALWLIGLVVGSGLLGLISVVLGFFSNRPHL